MRPTPAIDKYIAPLFRTTGEKPLLFTLELELLSAPLHIKRTLKIPSNMNLGYVQEVLMLAMGWEGYHLKEIQHGNYTYFVRLAVGQDPEPIEGFPQRDSFKYTLGDLLKEEWDSFIFVYDLGDAWKHRVTLTDIAPCKEEDAKEDSVAAYLVSGENACPPEDVGGVDGYADALKSFSYPEDDEYESIRTWMGEDFDPHFFDLRSARRRVDDFQRAIGEARWGFYHQ